MSKKPPHKVLLGKKKAPDRRRNSTASVSRAELARLEGQLQEAQDALEALHTTTLEAVAPYEPAESQVASLEDVDLPYRTYVEQMQDGALTISSDGALLYCNRRFAELLQQPVEKLLVRPASSLLSVSAWSRIASVLADGDGVVSLETTLVRADGAELPVNLSASRLSLDGQKVICLLITDLSEQRTRAELQRAKDAAERANHAKDSFLATLSHELRTPLTPALMVAANLEGDVTLPEGVRRNLATIRRNVELEARLIDDLLDLTRISRGKLELHSGLIDVHHSLKSALEICQPDIAAKQQLLNVQLEATDSETTGDAVRVQQVLWNLIRNASKFTPSRGQITIRTGNRDGQVWLEITDTGIGFEPAMQAMLFEPFEQGGRHITQKFGGLGLGLAISRSIVEAHGGVLRGRSDGAGKGATFTLVLPLVKPPTVAVKSTQNVAAAPVAFPAPKLRILLVEDHKDTRTNMALLLRRYQHEVTTAGSAVEALEIADVNTFDLVISDLGLPDQSGLEMMRTLRDRFGLRGIAVSGYGMEDDIAQSHEAGFVHHLTKPIAFDRLKLLIAEMGR